MAAHLYIDIGIDVITPPKVTALLISRLGRLNPTICQRNGEPISAGIGLKGRGTLFEPFFKKSENFRRVMHAIIRGLTRGSALPAIKLTSLLISELMGTSTLHTIR